MEELTSSQVYGTGGTSLQIDEGLNENDVVRLDIDFQAEEPPPPGGGAPRKLYVPNIVHSVIVKAAQTYIALSCDTDGAWRENYRYGFNGQQKDEEIAGVGNSLDFKFRIYDPRLGRFLSIDPLIREYPYYTPYSFAGNKPIAAIDIEGLEEFWVTARSFIPQPKLSNPDPLSSTQYPYYLGDNRQAYKADAGKSFRTEQYANINFYNNTTATNQTANSTTAVNSQGGYVTSSTASKNAGQVTAGMSNNNAAARVSFVIDAKNQLAAARDPFVPAINAKINVEITPQDDGSFNYTLSIPEMDGFPAFEVWVTDEKGTNYLLFGRNPIESKETPMDLFGSGEHQYNVSGNSKDLSTAPEQTFERRKNPKECSDCD